MLKRSLLLFCMLIIFNILSFSQNPLLLDDLSKISINKLSSVQLRQSLLYYRNNIILFKKTNEN